jgi:hypothetical protein
MQTKKLLGLVVLIGLLGLVGTVALAGAAFYNFDNLTPGVGNTPLVLPGVTFTPHLAGGVSANATAPSLPNVYLAQIQALVGTNTLLTITFDQPASLVKFQMFWSGLADSYTVNALDSNGSLLDSEGFATASSGHYDLIVLSAKGIKTLVISTTNTTLGIGSIITVLLDNFSFVKGPGGAVIPLL